MSEEILLPNSERIVRMIGEYVAVCWNVDAVRKTAVIDGEGYETVKVEW